MKKSFSSSLKIEKEGEFDEKINNFNEFLTQVKEDVRKLRNKYIPRISKDKMKDFMSKSFIITSDNKHIEEIEEEKCKQINEENLNKSLPNFKKFIVRLKFIVKMVKFIIKILIFIDRI